MADPAVAAAQVLAAEAQATLEETDKKVSPSLFDQIPKVIIAGLVMAIWATVVIVMMLWINNGDPGAAKFSCNTQAVPPSTTPTDCTNAWTVQFDAMKDVLTTAVVPVVTLVLGFYFGRQVATGGED